MAFGKYGEAPISVSTRTNSATARCTSEGVDPAMEDDVERGAIPESEDETGDSDDRAAGDDPGSQQPWFDNACEAVILVAN